MAEWSKIPPNVFSYLIKHFRNGSVPLSSRGGYQSIENRGDNFDDIYFSKLVKQNIFLSNCISIK